MDSDAEPELHVTGGSAGSRLRAARQAQGLTLEEVAARTRVPMRHLAMIEQGVFEALPAATYSAGFVKAYARILGLDRQALSDQFRREIGSAVTRPSRPEPFAPADPRRTPPLGLAIAALLVALVVGLGFLYWRGSSDQPVAIAARGVATLPVVPAASGPAPVARPLSTPATAAAGSPVTIGASQDVWVKVSDSGKTLFMGTLKPGNQVAIPADAVAPELTTGRPGVTTISVGSTPIPPIGDPDRAAHGISLKADALLARVGTPPPAVQPAPGAPTPVEGAAGPA